MSDKPYVPFDWEAYEKQKLEEQAKYERIKKEVEETQQKSAETLAGLNETFKNIDSAIKGAQKTQQDIDNFQKKFDSIFQALGEKLFSAFQQEESFKANSPEEITAKSIEAKDARHLLNGNIMILSGAGLSYASGIPTFRGEGGFWKNGEDTYACQKVLTKDFLDKSPEKCWKWHQEFQEILKKKQPNEGHKAIANYYMKHKKSTFLVTQNIDDLLTSCLEKDYRSKGFHNQIIEIHGNIKYMRCMNDCSDKDEHAFLFDMPDLSKQLMPTCPNCNGVARPHILFFDESYTNEHYRRQEVMDAFEKCDVLMVIGTTLETGLSASLVRKAVQQNKTIIEINTEPIIQRGCTFTVKGKSEEILSILLNEE